MDSAGKKFKKVFHNDSNENTSDDKNDSECSGSEEIGFIPTKKDKQSGATHDCDEKDDTNDSMDAAIVQRLKEEEARKKGAEDSDCSNIEEVAQQASETEDKDFKVLWCEHDSQSRGEELLFSLCSLSFLFRCLTY